MSIVTLYYQENYTGKPDQKLYLSLRNYLLTHITNSRHSKKYSVNDRIAFVVYKRFTTVTINE